MDELWLNLGFVIVYSEQVWFYGQVFYYWFVFVIFIR